MFLDVRQRSVWAMVYDKIADFVSLSSHSTLKSFNHTPNAWILLGENYLCAGYLVNNLLYYVTAGQQKTQALLDLETYVRLQAILGTDTQ